MSGAPFPPLDELAACALERFEAGVCVGCAREPSPDLARPYLCPACAAAIGGGAERVALDVAASHGVEEREARAVVTLAGAVARRLFRPRG